MAKSGRRAGRAQLLRESWFTEVLEDALTQVFEQFDVDSDGLLSIQELQALSTPAKKSSISCQSCTSIRGPDTKWFFLAGRYSRAVNNGEELRADEIEQVNDYFETKNGCLTHAGFLQMYYMQTDSRPEDTVQDLERLGYSPQTLKLVKPLPEPEPDLQPAACLTAAEKKRLKNARKRQRQKAKKKADTVADVRAEQICNTESEAEITAEANGDCGVVKTVGGKTLRMGGPPPQVASNPALAVAVAAAEAADAEEFGSEAKPAQTTAGEVHFPHRFLRALSTLRLGIVCTIER